MRHVLATTTVNIAGSSVNSEAIIAGEINTTVPNGFFYNNLAIGAFLPHDIRVRRSLIFDCFDN